MQCAQPDGGARHAGLRPSPLTRKPGQETPAAADPCTNAKRTERDMSDQARKDAAFDQQITVLVRSARHVWPAAVAAPGRQWPDYRPQPHEVRR
jgi:hypothetical protein